MTTTEKIIKYFEENPDTFADCIEELDSYNGYLGDDRYYAMEELSEIYGDTDPIEILERAYYGYDAETYTTDENGTKHYESFCPNRCYFTFNGYGNLVSADYKDYSAYLDEHAVTKMMEHRRDIYAIRNEPELDELLDELEEEE